MIGDMIRPVRRIAISILKQDSAVTDLVAASSIHPLSDPQWPFIRADGFRATPRGVRCTSMSEVRFMLHGFAKPRYASGAMIETAEDHAARIGSAIKDALHRNRLTTDGIDYSFRVLSSQLMRDGAEADAWHVVVNVFAQAREQ